MNTLEVSWQRLVEREVAQRLRRKQRRVERMGQKINRPIKPIPPKEEVIERFLKFTKPSHTGCLVWLGSRLPKGYGIFYFGGETLAHRISWGFFGGVIPDDLFICHTCDNPSCVNVAHLFPGTNEDNCRDAKAKGRLKRIGIRRLVTRRAATHILSVYKMYHSFGRKNLPNGILDSLSKMHGISKSMIGHIGHGREYRETSMDPPGSEGI